MNGGDPNDIFSPNLNVLNAQELNKAKQFGSTDSDYFWFNLPHHLELQQELKVTIYCSFDFSYFPFDSHICDFNYGSLKLSTYVLYLVHPWVRTGLKLTKNLKEPIDADKSYLPFDITIESLDNFNVYKVGYNYSYAGMRLHLKRNSLGLLIGGFYGPTAIFTVLSLISYTINPEIVTLITSYHIIACSLAKVAL